MERIRAFAAVAVLVALASACGNDRHSEDPPTPEPVSRPVAPPAPVDPQLPPLQPHLRLDLISVEERACKVDAECALVPVGDVCECVAFMGINEQHKGPFEGRRQGLTGQACPEVAACTPGQAAVARCVDGACREGRLADLSCVDEALSEMKRPLDVHPPRFSDQRLPGLQGRPVSQTESVVSVENVVPGHYRVVLEGKADASRYFCILNGDCLTQSSSTCTYCPPGTQECSTTLHLGAQAGLMVVRDCEGCSVSVRPLLR